MKSSILLLLATTSAILGSSELPFRIRKTHDGIHYDIIFMPVKLVAPGKDSPELHYKITGNINGESISEIAFTRQNSGGNKTGASYRTEAGIEFVLQNDENNSSQLKNFIPETASVSAWIAPRVKRKKDESDALAAKYGFKNASDLNEFRQKNSELITKALSMGEADPLDYAVKYSQRQILNENRPDHIIQWKILTSGLKGKYQNALTPIWTKGDLASVSEKKALRSAIFEVARSRLIFIEAVGTDVVGYHIKGRSLTEGDRISIMKHSHVIRTYNVPLDLENIPLNRDILKLIGELADALHFISSDNFDFRSVGEIGSVSKKYYR